jgi:hypothetical protein
MNERFWTDNPTDLFSKINFIPCSTCTVEENYNRITRFIIITFILVSFIKKSTKILYVGLFLIATIALLYFIDVKQMNGFDNINYGSYNVTPAGPYGQQSGLLYRPNNPTYVEYQQDRSVSPYHNPMYAYGMGPQINRIANEISGIRDPSAILNTPVLRAPTSNNPFMNVMPMDYGAVPVFADYTRYEKPSYPTPKTQEIRRELNEGFIYPGTSEEDYDPEKDFQKKLWQDANGRLFDRNNSQRQYVSQPVGSVPNNQSEFANWLYASPGGNNCKQGSIYDKYGLEYTDDSLLCNGFNVASPTNQGLLDGNLMSSVQR